MNIKNLVDVRTYGFAVDVNAVQEYANSDTILLHKNVLDALEKARENDLPTSYTFKILDGYRTLETQRNIVRTVEKELKLSHPESWEKLLKIYTGGYEELEHKTDAYYMEHLSGRTVDITLLKDNNDIDVGGCTYTDKDSLNFYEDKDDLTENEINIRDNRRILKKALLNNSFTPFEKEWWHWGYYGDGKKFKMDV